MQGDDRRPNGYQLDEAAYPWQFIVQDRFGRDRLLGLGTDVNAKGETVGVGVCPDYWTADNDTCDQIAFAMRGWCQRIQDENRRRREAEETGS